MLENTIGKKWLKIEISPHEDVYESLPFIYYKEANMLVSVLRYVIEIPPNMGGSWNDSDKKMSKVVIESSKGMMISHSYGVRFPSTLLKTSPSSIKSKENDRLKEIERIVISKTL